MLASSVGKNGELEDSFGAIRRTRGMERENAARTRDFVRYPKRKLFSISTVGGEEILWQGTGWTGQPVVWTRSDGIWR